MKNKKILADFIAFIHFIWHVWFAVSLPLLLIYPWYKWVILAGVVTMFVSWVIWGDCLFIIWENDLRKKVDPKNVYDPPFISFYIKKYFKVDISKKTVAVIRNTYILILIAIITYQLI